MQDTIRISIEFVVFVLMLVVGLDCSISEFRKAGSRPGLIATVTLLQFFCIPAMVLAIVSLLGTAPGLAAGLLLISACPSGSISNTYTFLTKGNTAFSVTLTTISCVVSFVATPAALFLIDSLAGEKLMQSLALPWQPLARQLLLMMALPVALGLLIRWNLPTFTKRVLGYGRKLSAILVLGLVGLIILTNPSEVGRQLQAIWLPALVITACLFLLASVVAAGFRLPPADRIALFFELPCRNLAIAALIGMSVLKRPELVFMATAFFLLEAAVLLLIAGPLAKSLAREQLLNAAN